MGEKLEMAERLEMVEVMGRIGYGGDWGERLGPRSVGLQVAQARRALDPDLHASVVIPLLPPILFFGGGP